MLELGCWAVGQEAGPVQTTGMASKRLISLALFVNTINDLASRSFASLVFHSNEVGGKGYKAIYILHLLT